MKNSIQLRVVGLFPTELFTKFEHIFNCSALKESEIILFCDYSGYDIEIGHTFSCIETPLQQNINTEIVLQKVGQGYAIAFELIPKGHKTICKFEFINGEIPQIIKGLDIINDWYESDKYLIFR